MKVSQTRIELFSSRRIISNKIIWVERWFGHSIWMIFVANSVAKGSFPWLKRSKQFFMDNWSYCRKKKFVRPAQPKNIKVGNEWGRMENWCARLIDFKPQTQPQTTEKTTKKPKKSKRDADSPSKSPFSEKEEDEYGSLFSASSSSTGRCMRRVKGWAMAWSIRLQKLLPLSWGGISMGWTKTWSVLYGYEEFSDRYRISSYLISGSYFDPNEKTCKWVGMDKVSFCFFGLSVSVLALISLTVKNWSKAMKTPLLVLPDQPTKKPMMTTMTTTMMLPVMRVHPRKRRNPNHLHPPVNPSRY